MKSYANFALVLFLSVISLTGFAQTIPAKPQQFNNFPSTINLSADVLESLFSSAEGENINLEGSDNFSFNGKVTSNLVKYSNLQTAVLRSPEYDNTIFSVSKITNADNSITYLGRIINKKYFDGFELKKNENGNYQLIKMETDKVIQDCKGN